MTVLIKRYGNRKLYDTQASCYVTLERIAEIVREGKDLRIIDNRTGEDLTAVTFAQIIFEEQKRKNGGLLGLPVLRWIIQQGGATLQEIFTSVDRGREALDSVRELAGKGMQQLAGMRTGGGAQGGGAHRAEAHGPEEHGPRLHTGRRFLEEILEVPQKQIEQLQHRIDAQVRASLDRVTAHPAVQSELRRIEHSVKALERQLHRFRLSQHRVASRRRSKRGAAGKGAGR